MSILATETMNKYLEEVLDPNKVMPMCGKHGYTPDKNMPPKTMGCKECWFAYFLHDIATTPSNLRMQRLEELEEVIHHLAEAQDSGNWDFKLFKHPQISVEKG